MRKTLIILLAVFPVYALSPVHAGSLVLRLRAVNPKDTTETVSIHSNLPRRVGPDDVMDSAGLEIGYDVRNSIYFVHGEVEVGPRDFVPYEIQIKDIWVIPGEELDLLRKQADSLAGQLKDTKHADLSEGAKKQIKTGLELIEVRQVENAIKPGNVVKHINAYEVNLQALSVVRKDLGQLENLVLSMGLNPGGLIGDDKTAAPPDRDVKPAPEDYGTAIFKITVFNPSPTEVRRIPNDFTPRLRRSLPSEIKVNDVLDTDGLELEIDSKSGICYVYKESLEIAPTGTVTFLVKIRDKWNINKPRVPSIMAKAADLLEVISTKGKYEEIEETLHGLIAELGGIEKEKGPGTLNAGYVAFYRDQAQRLDKIEIKINRILAALKPKSITSQLGFKAKAPSMKTTWMIIYIILGFLAVMSLLFFLRWYGKTQGEENTHGH